MSFSPCLLDTPRFQSWWVTRELPCCSQIPSSHPWQRGKNRHAYTATHYDGRKRGKTRINRCRERGCRVLAVLGWRIIECEWKGQGLWWGGVMKLCGSIHEQIEEKTLRERDAESQTVLSMRCIILSVQGNLFKTIQVKQGWGGSKLHWTERSYLLSTDLWRWSPYGSISRTWSHNNT